MGEMTEATVTVKRVRKDVCHVTYSDGGVEGRTLRFVVRGELPQGTAATPEALRGVLQALPEDRGVYAAYSGLLEAMVWTSTVRVPPGGAAVLIEVAEFVAGARERLSAGGAESLARQFNAAASDLFAGNVAPMADLLSLLPGEVGATAPSA